MELETAASLAPDSFAPLAGREPAAGEAASQVTGWGLGVIGQMRPLGSVTEESFPALPGRARAPAARAGPSYAAQARKKPVSQAEEQMKVFVTRLVTKEITAMPASKGEALESLVAALLEGHLEGDEFYEFSSVLSPYPPRSVVGVCGH